MTKRVNGGKEIQRRRRGRNWANLWEGDQDVNGCVAGVHDVFVRSSDDRRAVGQATGDRRQYWRRDDSPGGRQAVPPTASLPIVILPGPVAPPGSKQGPGAAAAAVGRAPSPGQPPSVRTEVAGCMAPVWPLGCPVHWRGSRSPNWRHHHGLASPAALPGASAG